MPATPPQNALPHTAALQRTAYTPPPPPLPLHRKISFFWTILSLATQILFVLTAFTILAIYAVSRLRAGDYFHATITLTLALAGTFMLFVAVVILRRNIHLGIRRELRNRNCCPHCSYDLRASALRCPECGHPLPAPNIEI